MAIKIKPKITGALILVLLALLLFFYYKAEIKTPKNANFSQWVALQASDEFVIATLITHETFTSSDNNQISLLGNALQLGSTNVSIELTAHYKYYVQFSALKHQLQGQTLIISAPALKLTKPVAFEFSSVKENGQATLLGPNKQALLQQVKNTLSDELTLKGLQQMPSVYDKAAKALADNINSYMQNNDQAGFYQTLQITFANEKSPSTRLYNYNNSFCTPEPCAWQHEMDGGKILIIK
jgi:hypothetical protein